MALVDHRHGGATLKVIGMATEVQQDILKERFKRLMRKLQIEGARKIAVVGM